MGEIVPDIGAAVRPDGVADLPDHRTVVDEQVDLVAAQLGRVRHRQGRAVHAIGEDVALAVAVSHRAQRAGQVGLGLGTGPLAALDLPLEPRRDAPRRVGDGSQFVQPARQHLASDQPTPGGAAGDEADEDQPDQQGQFGGETKIIESTQGTLHVARSMSPFGLKSMPDALSGHRWIAAPGPVGARCPSPQWASAPAPGRPGRLMSGVTATSARNSSVRARNTSPSDRTSASPRTIWASFFVAAVAASDP